MNSDTIFRPINCELTEKALIFYLAKEVRRTGCTKAVLGLSGGIDSAVVTCLAAKALGPENVTGLLLPYRTSSRHSIEDAYAVVKATGIQSHILDISAAADALAENNMIDKEYMFKHRLGNILARLRMISLFDYSLAHGAIVLGTSNKSEIALGYATLFGDAASALNPIGDLYKADVFALARHLCVPQSIIDKPPSADLWEGQTDEGEIGFSYAEMDMVLYQLIDEHKRPEVLISEGFPEKLVLFLAHRILSMQFKRKIPVSAKLSGRTFGCDITYPKDILT